MKRKPYFVGAVLACLVVAEASLAAAPPAKGGAAASKQKKFVPDANMPRSQIPARYKWRLAPLFKDDAACAAGLKQAAAQRVELAKFKGELADGKKLAACLDLYFKIRLLTNKATLYSSMRLDSEQKSTKLQAQNDRALDAMRELQTQAAFIRQEVLALDAAALEAALAREPRLVEYRPYLDEIRRRRAHVLDAQAERVLALAGDNLWAEIDLNELPTDYEKAFDGLLNDIPLPRVKDDQGQEVQLTLSNYGKLRASDNRAVRSAAVEALFGALRQFQHALAATYSGQVRFDVFLARARGYPTALAAYLDKDNIDPAVYHSLIQAVHANLKPLHRYVALRKKVMKLDAVRLYDLYPPLVPSVKWEVPYEEALRILPVALAPLGEDYVKVLKQGLDPKAGWTDVYPHADKESGAYSSSVYGIHPFVKMNYFDEVDDLSTLAHEYGHALHSHLSMTTQPYVTSSYSMFLAEIASTCNEKLLSDYLVAHAKNDAEKLYILYHLAETIRTTIYRQTLFAEFELKTHSAVEAGTPLTAELLNTTYADLIQTYYGKDYTLGPNDEMEWAYIPHLYYKYYVYSYATGLSSGIAIAERVQQQGAPARDAYLGMLKGGTSKPPLELLRGAGVDLAKPQAIEAAARLLDGTLAEMESILDKSAR
ncbi:MAG: oligoendopeptidase F [Deltaproteobacteria bacterium]|nr:oligoendopeptidase F [Deltaproteobacteria bacterium]